MTNTLSDLAIVSEVIPAAKELAQMFLFSQALAQVALSIGNLTLV